MTFFVTFFTNTVLTVHLVYQSEVLRLNLEYISEDTEVIFLNTLERVLRLYLVYLREDTEAIPAILY